MTKNCIVIPVSDNKGIEGKEQLEALLKSLDNAEASIVCCMDNCKDSFNFYFQDNYPNVTYIINEGNRLGFAPNSNRGLRYAFKELKADRVMLCNQDCILPSWTYLQALFMHEGLVSAVSVGELSEDFLDLDDYNAAYEDGPGLEHNLVEKFAGYCWVIHKDVIEKIGYLDERFVSSFEDDDYILRAHLAGFPVGTLSVCINHKGSHIDQNALGGSLTGAYNGERLMLNLQKYYWKYQIPGEIPHDQVISYYTKNFTWQDSMYEP